MPRRYTKEVLAGFHGLGVHTNSRRPRIWLTHHLDVLGTRGYRCKSCTLSWVTDSGILGQPWRANMSFHIAASLARFYLRRDISIPWMLATEKMYRIPIGLRT